MCLIAYQPAGDEPFAREILENGWDANHHGAGFMFVADGKLQIRKPFRKLKELIAEYSKEHTAHGATSAFCIHFRWATHGSDDVVNIHPHILADGQAGLVHNGILHNFDPPSGKDLSDTAWFCRTVLAGRTPQQLTSVEFGCVLAEMIGKNNKFVLMAADGSAIIVNPTSGVYEGKRWFSNTSHRQYNGGMTTGSGTIARGLVLPPAGKRKRKRKWESRNADLRALPQHYLSDEETSSIDAWDDYREADSLDLNIDPQALWDSLGSEDRDTLEGLYDEALDGLIEEADKMPAGTNADWDLMDEAAWRMARDCYVQDHERYLEGTLSTELATDAE
jgi:hypothetical protein